MWKRKTIGAHEIKLFPLLKWVQGSQIRAEIKAENKYCDVGPGESDFILAQFKRGNYFVNLLVLLAAIISLILSVKHIYKIADVYMTASFYYRRNNRGDNQEYSNFMNRVYI